MNENRLQKITLIAGFILFFSIPLVTGTWMDTFSTITGDRSIQNLVRIKSEITREYDKNLFFRQEIIKINNTIRINLLGEKIFNDVVIGKNGWLYYSGESNLEDYQKTRRFTNAEMNEINQQLAYTNRWMKENNIHFYVVIAPNKETIYPENLPNYIQKTGENNRLDQIRQDLDKNNQQNIIDLSQILKEKSEKQQLYYRTDTHWNFTGAWIGYRTVLDKMNADGLKIQAKGINEFKQGEEEIQGDLSRLLPLFKPFQEKSITLVQKEPIRANGYNTDQANISISEVADDELLKIIIFHDSFMNGMMHYFSEHFRKCIYVHQFQIDYGLVEKEKPDIVLLEINERYLQKLLNINENRN